VKQLFLRLIAALLAFSIGVGLDRLVNSKPAQGKKPPIVSSQPLSSGAAYSVVAAAPTPLSTPKPTLIFDYDAGKFWPEGNYAIVGKRPKGFSRDDYFFIEIWQGDHTDEHVWFSVLDDRGNTDLSASFALVTDKRLFFVTQPSSDGFVYRFDAEFLRRGAIYDAPERKAVLKGTLTISKDNRTVAEWPMRFGVVHDGC
jgi:hypothetical protein